MSLALQVTDAASQALAELSQEAKGAFIRVSAGQACGCGRIGYRMAWENQRGPADEAVEAGGMTLVVDEPSRPYLDGGVIDFQQDTMQKGFVIENPTVQSGCSCGGHH